MSISETKKKNNINSQLFLFSLSLSVSSFFSAGTTSRDLRADRFSLLYFLFYFLFFIEVLMQKTKKPKNKNKISVNLSG